MNTIQIKEILISCIKNIAKRKDFIFEQTFNSKIKSFCLFYIKLFIPFSK